MVRERGSSRSGKSSRTSRNERTSSRSSKGSKSGFKYRNRSLDAAKKRADQKANDFDSIFKDNIKLYKVGEENDIRILPPTWEDAEHFGFDIYVHYQIGPDKSSFLCLDKHGEEKCPICEERAQAEKDGDSDYANSLKANKRVAMWILDRNNEKDGAMIWAAPWTVDRDISTQGIDRKTQEVIPIDDPENGYDISFQKTGKGRNTKYVGISIARRSSEASDDIDEVLEFITENPIPDCLEIKDADYISEVFAGHSHKSEEDEDEDEKEEKKGRNSKKTKEPDYTWEEIHEMVFEDLEDLVNDQELDEVIDLKDYDEDNIEELADVICEELGVEKPKRSTRDKSKARSMRDNRR